MAGERPKLLELLPSHWIPPLATKRTQYFARRGAAALPRPARFRIVG